MDSSTFPRLLGDIGGTNARFALQTHASAAPSAVAVLPAGEHASFQDAVRHYLAAQPGPRPLWCAIGIANPVTGDEIRMTNHHWHFSIEGARQELGLQRLVVVNDFTALAMALPDLAPSDLRQVGGGTPVPGGVCAILGAGTGLGVSGLWPATAARGAVAMAGEGGHVTLSATNEREAQVIEALRRRFGHASAERALSGQGLENLDAALCELDGLPPQGLAAAQVTERAMAGTDPVCVETVHLFLSLLGTTAGNLALTLGARGGVYIAGGIVPRLGSMVEASAFRAKFEAKGRFAPYLAQIPTFVIAASVSPALLGAARVLESS